MSAYNLEQRQKILLLFIALISLCFITSCSTSNKTASVRISVSYEFQWPQNEVSSLLPVPESNIGRIIRESSTGFGVDVHDISRVQYDAYVDKCVEAGFSFDQTQGDVFYYAYNNTGCSLNLFYDVDESYMTIYIDEPEDVIDSEDNHGDQTDTPMVSINQKENKKDEEISNPEINEDYQTEDEQLTLQNETISFQEESALRAVVVAFTNVFANDIYTENGGDIDFSKFHSFADTSDDISEYFMFVNMVLLLAKNGVKSKKEKRNK